MKISITILSLLLFPSLSHAQLSTPFEKGKGDISSTYFQCIKFYKQLDMMHEEVGMYTYGETDAGYPLHLVVVSDQKVPGEAVKGQFIDKIRAEKKTVLLVMNGIHPGEPCGIDASMMLARDLVANKSELLKNTVVCIIPVYNIGGALNRSATSRANQIGPKQYGFRGNAKNLDLNRDFVKGDSKNTWAFWKLYHEWKPDVFLDNHTTNGSDHQYTMTLIASQKDKQDYGVKQYMEKMVPMLYEGMEEKGDEMSPYVNIHGKPMNGYMTGFLETPRYSTGYTTLFGTVSFVAEAHMLKPFKNRVESNYRLMEVMLKTMGKTKADLLDRNKKTLIETTNNQIWPIYWELDKTQFETIEFKGYEAEYATSAVTGQQRYFYNRKKPFTTEIKFLNTYKPTVTVDKPFAYIIPQGWEDVVARLKANKCLVKRLKYDTTLMLEYYRIGKYNTVDKPYEGHYLHNKVSADLDSGKMKLRAGDYVVILPNRFALETLEPMAHDAFFAWNFFDPILQQKEWFSSYVFEEKAEELLKSDKELRESFEAKRQEDEEFAANAFAQLAYIYRHSPYYEPSHMRYPVYRLQKVTYLPTKD